MRLERVCVYCASSRQTDGAYYEAAACLGRALAQRGVAIVYGGGAVGSMGGARRRRAGGGREGDRRAAALHVRPRVGASALDGAPPGRRPPRAQAIDDRGG